MPILLWFCGCIIWILLNGEMNFNSHSWKRKADKINWWSAYKMVELLFGMWRIHCQAFRLYNNCLVLFHGYSLAPTWLVLLKMHPQVTMGTGCERVNHAYNSSRKKRPLAVWAGIDHISRWKASETMTQRAGYLRTCTTKTLLIDSLKGKGTQCNSFSGNLPIAGSF